MIYKILCLVFTIALISCGSENAKQRMVVYPEYCGGCVTRNFETINQDDMVDKYDVYFDTTDLFILKTARLNGLKYYHIGNHEIRAKFGDYANIVIFSNGKWPKELRTNETIKTGSHF